MQLEKKLRARREELAPKWAEMILGTYPEETQKIWGKTKDQFHNPVGNTILETATELYDLVLDWEDADAIARSLEKMIKIRAVQDFAPSRGLSFVYLYKKLLRDVFFEELEEAGALDEFLRFETRVDNLALIAFDIYSTCRERLFDQRVTEVKKSQYNLLRRAKMIVDCSADEAE
ncbi:MAG: RsbRD N-terminal domain-containing protein [Desulfovibrio sp.]